MLPRSSRLIGGLAALLLATAPAYAVDWQVVGTGDTGNPPFDIDWSLGLRGGVSFDDGGDSEWEATATPSLTLRQETMRGGYGLALDGEVALPEDGDVQLRSLGVTVDGNYALDSVTRLDGSLTVTATQDDDDDDSTIATPPTVLSGTVQGSVSREVGLFEFALRGSAGRTVNGDTTYVDDTTSSNEHDNTTRYGTGLRVALPVSPGLAAFVDADAVREDYDLASPSLLVKLDNMTYAAQAGLMLRGSEVFEAEASIGVAWRDFADDGLDDVSAMLYDARATFRPSESLSLTGSLVSSLGAPSSTGATAELSYLATGEATYQMNPWLRLRGSASWEETRQLGTSAGERAWGFGVGADYLVNRHTDLTADYGFTRTTPYGGSASDEHQLSLGVRFHR